MGKQRFSLCNFGESEKGELEVRSCCLVNEVRLAVVVESGVGA